MSTQFAMGSNFLKYTITAFTLFTSLSHLCHAQTDSVETTTEFFGKGEKELQSAVKWLSKTDVRAEPIGGMIAFYSKVYNKMVVPGSFKEPSRSFVQVTIDSLGRITKVRTIKGVHGKVDEILERALSKLDSEFKPARNQGVPVESDLIIPFYFNYKSD